ncbi:MULTISPECIES: RNA-binding S4 domain-containing protein [Aeromicrobium]|uniref:RNA-binding S4 domain-containing protein n=1 Tax=Aeromicrobium TaxID=2040 RepID=UPI0006F72C68|nr:MULTISPECIES: RNA-binding S4 domain-containing protein [Aeromicrobium]KQX76313.1 RNA-binding protein [Aeromicrobium sp. Root472D3]MBD8608029.1 RNA-binding S4 domain-containing protein [Aeromicrobium sp. CFBP 8757]
MGTGAGDDDIEVIEISGDMIRLGQFLKFANFADSGAHAGAIIGDGDVLVDGTVETRRGRQLAKGMVVEVRTAAETHVARVG